MRQPATALFLLALESGCLERERLEVEEHGFELGRDAVARMLARGADVSIAYETPTLRAVLADPGVRILSALHTSHRNTRLVVRKDRVDAVAALRGARIGLAQGSNAEFHLDLVLRFGGVPPAAVTVVDLVPEASVVALARGDLDAAVLSDPYAARAEQVLGDGGRVLETDLYTEVSFLLTREDVLAGRGEALRRLLRGLACAEREWRERPAESLARIRPRFPELSEDELRDQVARVRWGLGLDHVMMGVLNDEGDWLRDAGVSGATLDLPRVVARRPLEEVDPEAVLLLPPWRGAP